jgi:crotonobetainyl-CoA hydratase
MELLLLGRRMTAQEAMHYGMLNAVVAKDKLMDTARDWAGRIAGGAPLTIQALKESLKAIEGKSIREGFDVIRSGTLPTYERALKSEDSKEGVRAFAERRPAVFRGR